MFCLRSRALPSTFKSYASSTSAVSQLTRTPIVTSTARLTTQQPQSITSTRQISSILTRPQLQSPLTRSLPSQSPISITSQLTQTRQFSASAMLAGPRDTYQPSRKVQKRRHGFLSRLRTRSGRKVMKHRRSKGRKNMSW